MSETELKITTPESDGGKRQMEAVEKSDRNPKKIIEDVRNRGGSLVGTERDTFLDMLEKGEASPSQAVALWAFLKCNKSADAGILQAKLFSQNKSIGLLISDLVSESSENKIVNSIARKLKGTPFTEEEIKAFIKTVDPKPDPKNDPIIAAFLVASFCHGLSENETNVLTLAMANSGDTLNFLDDPHVVDKHSTGGVGDKLTLTVLPLAAAMGLKVGKMSGPGLGDTGGTVDKLESIPGYNTEIDKDIFLERLNSSGMVLVGSSTELAPADKKLYALRDVTGTVPSIQLIAASIMSKKIAGGAGAIVLDVKYGAGAFMKTPEDAEKLGKVMQKIGKNLGRKVSVLISSMEAPLGFAVGNATEILEAIEVLRGSCSAQAEDDLIEITVTLAAMMKFTAGLSPSFEEAYKEADETLASGVAYKKFLELVESHGGDISKLTEKGLGLLDSDIVTVEIPSPKDGYVLRVDPIKIAKAVNSRGAGRQVENEEIDHRVGFSLLPIVGMHTSEGRVLALAHVKASEDQEKFIAEVLAAVDIQKADTYPEEREIIYARHLA